MTWGGTVWHANILHSLVAALVLWLGWLLLVGACSPERAKLDPDVPEPLAVERVQEALSGDILWAAQKCLFEHCVMCGACE